MWVWRGGSYTTIPKAMVIDALLRAYAAEGFDGHAAASDLAEPYEMPSNLRQYFEGRAAVSAGAVSEAGAAGSVDDRCCGDGEMETCCDPDERETCCGSSASAGGASVAPKECGCR